MQYSEFTVPLVKAVQELDAKVEVLEAALAEKDKLILELTRRVEWLESNYRELSVEKEVAKQ